MIAYDDEKMSAKKLAQNILADGVRVTGDYWGEKDGVDYEAMTDREREQVERQLTKLGYRIEKLLGFPLG